MSIRSRRPQKNLHETFTLAGDYSTGGEWKAQMRILAAIASGAIMLTAAALSYTWVADKIEEFTLSNGNGEGQG
jgi:hypothetical protein